MPPLLKQCISGTSTVSMRICAHARPTARMPPTSPSRRSSRRSPRCRGHGDQVTAWLFRIARNVAHNFNQRQRSTITWDLVPEALRPRDERSVEAGLLREEALVPLRALLKAQSPEVHELLMLRFVAQLTVAEIAAVIGKSEAATSKQLSRVIQRLQEHYDDYDR